MDLSKLSDADLTALQAGDLTKLSNEGLTALHTSSTPAVPQTTFAQTAAQYGLTGAGQTGPTLNPVTRELQDFAANAWIGMGRFWPTVGLRLRQGYSAVTGGLSLDPEIAEQRKYDQPLLSTVGGKVGTALPYIALAAMPGANTAFGAAAYGGLAGLAQPTVSGETTLGMPATLGNTALGAGTALGAYGVGQGLSAWATRRATQPLMGWTRSSADEALAAAVGSKALRLDQTALGQRAQELADTFSAGRNAATSVDLSSTPATLDQALSGINPSARTLVEANPNVSDLLTHATGTGTTNGQILGRISTGLRQDAYTALNSEGGNREVGLALQGIRNHVEDLIQGHIADPALREAYAVARPQYGLLQDVRYNPSVLNAVTGRTNMEALGKYLQRNTPAYTSAGAGESPLFNAAMWGQAGGGAKGAPSFNLAAPWKLPAYALTHNPLARLTGGVVSRAVAPLGPVLRPGLEGLAFGTTPVALPYLEQ